MRVITVSDVEAAAGNGHKDIVPSDPVLVTPLARDRAAVLGVRIVDGPYAAHDAPATEAANEGVANGRRRPPAPADVGRLVLESKVRTITRRLLLRRGHGFTELEDIVAAVMSRLEGSGGTAESTDCSCGCCHGGDRR